MSHRTAFYIALVFIAIFAMDAIFQDWAGTIFLARKLYDLILWIQFWR